MVDTDRKDDYDEKRSEEVLFELPRFFCYDDGEVNIVLVPMDILRGCFVISYIGRRRWI